MSQLNQEITRIARSGWRAHAVVYLAKLGEAEYTTFLSTRRRKQDRYSPSDYHRDLVMYLNTDNEEGFKALKMLRHAYSALRGDSE